MDVPRYKLKSRGGLQRWHFDFESQNLEFESWKFDFQIRNIYFESWSFDFHSQNFDFESRIYDFESRNFTLKVETIEHFISFHWQKWASIPLNTLGAFLLLSYIPEQSHTQHLSSMGQSWSGSAPFAFIQHFFVNFFALTSSILSLHGTLSSVTRTCFDYLAQNLLASMLWWWNFSCFQPQVSKQLLRRPQRSGFRAKVWTSGNKPFKLFKKSKRISKLDLEMEINPA